VLRLRRCERK